MSTAAVFNLVAIFFFFFSPFIVKLSFCFEGSFNVIEQNKILPVHGPVRKVCGWSPCSVGPQSA